MKPTMPRVALALCVLLLFWLALPPLSAQSLDASRLPRNTVFYVASHGAPVGDLRKTNSLLALWDDPDFSPVRQAMFENLMRDSGQPGSLQNTLGKEDMAEFLSLFDNEIIFGYIARPNADSNDVPAGPDAKPAPKWNGGFLAFDRTGKETTLAKLLVRARAAQKVPPAVSTVMIAGLPAMKVEQDGRSSYWLDTGKYALNASEPAVVEQLIAWTKRADTDGNQLAQVAGYKEAADVFKGSTIQLFFQFPGFKDAVPDANAGGFRVAPMLQALKLSAVHSIAASVSFEATRTRTRGAILGDPAQGTLFDIWDDATATPVSQGYLGPNVVSYHSSRLNLTGIYTLLKQAILSVSPQGQSPLDLIETAAKTRLGMPLPDALALFSGEIATIQGNTTLDSSKQVYVFGIRKKPEALKLLRTGFADRVTSERTEGEVTFLKISEGGIQSDAGTASYKYFHVAVTPDAVLAASRLDLLRETLAVRKPSIDPATQMPPFWLAARSQFPKDLNGPGFMDLQKVDWPALRERLLVEEQKTMRTTSMKGQPAETTLFRALKDTDAKVFSRHLHHAVSASWKDAQGIHFDSWME